MPAEDELLNRARYLTEIVRRFSERRILVVGDLVADQFIYGEISRISREAPVLILRHERTETVPGGAANCALNLAALGAQVAILGKLGNDAAGAAVRAKLIEAGVDCDPVIASAHGQTTTKVRVLAGGAHSMRQQVIRIDYDADPTPAPDEQRELLSTLRARANEVDAIIVSDYNYGVAGRAVIDELRRIGVEKLKPVLVDSRYRLAEFSGFTSATPNEDEVEGWRGNRLNDEIDLEAASVELRRELGLQALLVTRGGRGMLLVEEKGEPHHIASVGARDAVDVTGAGDTVIATYTLALASGASALDAAHLANHAGGIVVMKRGTAAATAAELTASIMQHET